MTENMIEGAVVKNSNHLHLNDFDEDFEDSKIKINDFSDLEYLLDEERKIVVDTFSAEDIGIYGFILEVSTYSRFGGVIPTFERYVAFVVKSKKCKCNHLLLTDEGETIQLSWNSELLEVYEVDDDCPYCCRKLQYWWQWQQERYLGNGESLWKDEDDFEKWEREEREGKGLW